MMIDLMMFLQCFISPMERKKASVYPAVSSPQPLFPSSWTLGSRNIHSSKGEESFCGNIQKG